MTMSRTNDGLVAHGALMGIRADHNLGCLHALGTVDVLRRWLDLVLLSDKVGTAPDADEVL